MNIPYPFFTFNYHYLLQIIRILEYTERSLV